MRTLYLSAIAAVAISASAFAVETPITLKEGPGRAAVENLCGGCHSLDYIRINAPFMNRQTWTAEVTKMINAFGAPIAQNDANVIIDYLAANYGDK